MKRTPNQAREDVNSEEEVYEITEAGIDMIRRAVLDGSMQPKYLDGFVQYLTLEELEQTLRLELVELYGAVKGRGLLRGRDLERKGARISAFLWELRKREGQAPL